MNISVIIPSFNQGEYLNDTIDSVLNQKSMIGEVELIIVDDGSTDDSLKIAKEYQKDYFREKNSGGEPNIHIKVISQVNKGLASARNTGIMNSTGDWILPLDADDMLLPNALHKIWSLINTFFPPDIVAPSFKCFGKGNETIILHPEIKLEMFKEGKNYLPYFCAFKREKLLEIGGYSPRMIFGWEDLHMHINLLSRGATIKTIPEVLVLYRTKENSMWTESTKHSEELFAQLRKDFPGGII